jgi:hypothetical protein
MIARATAQPKDEAAELRSFPNAFRVVASDDRHDVAT